jgi:hypothetical protein
MAYLTIGARCLIGLVFVVSAVAKLRSASAFGSFTAWLAGLPLPFVHSRAAAIVMAGTEVAIVVLVAAPWTVLAGMLLAAAALAAFATGTSAALRRGTQAACQCFGRSRGALGRRHVVRDVLLCALAIAGAAGSGQGGARPAGIALTVGAAAVATLFVVFLDDVVALFDGTGLAPGPAVRSSSTLKPPEGGAGSWPGA